jgi:hypothetical protein
VQRRDRKLNVSPHMKKATPSPHAHSAARAVFNVELRRNGCAGGVGVAQIDGLRGLLPGPHCREPSLASAS